MQQDVKDAIIAEVRDKLETFADTHNMAMESWKITAICLPYPHSKQHTPFIRIAQNKQSRETLHLSSIPTNMTVEERLELKKHI